MQEGSKDKIKRLNSAFGKIVEKYRKAQNKTAYKISAECALSKTSWREVELGKKDFRFSTLWRIAEGLDIPLENLINEVSLELGDGFSLSDLK